VEGILLVKARLLEIAARNMDIVVLLPIIAVLDANPVLELALKLQVHHQPLQNQLPVQSRRRKVSVLMDLAPVP